MSWIKQYQNHAWAIQDQLRDRGVQQMDIAMRAILEKVVDDYLERGHYQKPSIELMYIIVEKFYRDVVKEAYRSSEIAKHLQQPKIQSSTTHMAKLPSGIPNRLPPLVKFFSDKRMWPVMRKRGVKIVDKLQKYYFKKIDRLFDQIGPQLQSGEKTPQEVKEELQKAWKVSKSRVNTIFQTETTNYFNKVQVSFFHDDEDIIGFLFQANRDADTTDICRARHGLVYRTTTLQQAELLRHNTPACHYNCRSELIPLANTPENRRLLEDPSRDPMKRSVPPLPDGWVAQRKVA